MGEMWGSRIQPGPADGHWVTSPQLLHIRIEQNGIFMMFLHKAIGQCRVALGWRTQECSHKYTVMPQGQNDTWYSITNMCIFNLGWVALLVVSLAYNLCIWAPLWSGVIYLPPESVAGPTFDPGSLDRAMFFVWESHWVCVWVGSERWIPHTTETLKC